MLKCRNCSIPFALNFYLVLLVLFAYGSCSMDEKTILIRLQQGDRSAFSFIFTYYYADLVNFAYTFTKDRDVSEEIIQEIFLKLWENRGSIQINTSVKSFLLRSVQNRCIDWIRHLDIHDKYRNSVMAAPLLVENDTDRYMLHAELQSSLKKALEILPEEISTVFIMNRFEGLTYQEISQKQGISVRTVEVRIGKALHFLRDKLKDYLLPALLVMVWPGTF